MLAAKDDATAKVIPRAPCGVLALRSLRSLCSCCSLRHCERSEAISNHQSSISSLFNSQFPKGRTEGIPSGPSAPKSAIRNLFIQSSIINLQSTIINHQSPLSSLRGAKRRGNPDKPHYGLPRYAYGSTRNDNNLPPSNRSRW